MVWIRESNSCIKNKGQHFSAFFLILSGRKIVQQGKKTGRLQKVSATALLLYNLPVKDRFLGLHKQQKKKKLTIPFKKIKLKTEKGKA